MDNGDRPASPMMTALEIAVSKPERAFELGEDWSGLSKREAFAMAAMQGLLGNPEMAMNNILLEDIKSINKLAILVANGQLKALAEDEHKK